MAEFSTLREFADAVHAEWGGQTPYEVGAEHLHTKVGPPYIVWVHTKVGHVYGGLDIGPVEDAAAGETTKQVFTRRVEVDVYVWAVKADGTGAADAAEATVNALMLAAYNTASGSVVMKGEDWPKQAGHQLLKRGEPVILRMSVDLNPGGWVQKTAAITSNDPAAVDFVDEL